MQRQAQRNDGELVILHSNSKVGSLSTPLGDLSSADKVSASAETMQGMAKRRRQSNFFSERKKVKQLVLYITKA